MSLSLDLQRFERRSRSGAIWTPTMSAQWTDRPVHPHDSWAPNLPGDRATVSLLDVYRPRPHVLVTVWGADDTGVEWEGDLSDCLTLYVALTRAPHLPRRETLLSLWGFRGG